MCVHMYVSLWCYIRIYLSYHRLVSSTYVTTEAMTNLPIPNKIETMILSNKNIEISSKLIYLLINILYSHIC